MKLHPNIDVSVFYMRLGSIPDKWKTSNIIPIFNKGDHIYANM